MQPALRPPPSSQGDTRVFFPRRQTLEITAEALMFLRDLFSSTRALVKDSFVKRLVLPFPTRESISFILCFWCRQAAEQFPTLTILEQRIYELKFTTEVFSTDAGSSLNCYDC